jgi:DNA (cytosine-5)-methyltransferase 1
MRYVSLFSGIEAASVAWGPLGFEPVCFAEVDHHCCMLLRERFPEVPNLGDVSLIDWSLVDGAVDIVIGGSPCQSFSVAGLRMGLADPRGNLMLEYVRAVDGLRPRWVVWENVPGVLSDGTGAFGSLLGALAELGYGFAYRVLDAQYFGVPQRRRRVFVVGCSGGRFQSAAAVLFDEGALRRPARKDARLRQGGLRRTGGSARRTFARSGFSSWRESDVAATLMHSSEGLEAIVLEDDGRARVLTPTEMERLQGFPDGWTDLPGLSPRRRHAMLGNSMAVPVIGWIGSRMKEVDGLCAQDPTERKDR